jgi:hypothetical protein
MFIDQNWIYMPLGLWVAATATKIVAEGHDYDSVIITLRNRGILLSDVAIVYVPTGIIQ